jgi:pimeloyl-ACP methyl ester carboxylesterase
MNRLSTILAAAAVLTLLTACSAEYNVSLKSPPAAATPYGANKAASGTFVHDGVALYYEVYGEGEPLLMLHGNGASIGSLAAQIEFFKKSRKVIALDSRDQGRSGDSTGPITYEKMADDAAALLDHLKAGPADVIGWSDGGIEALLLGVRHPGKVKKLVAMAANLNPSTQAIYPETAKMVEDLLAAIPADARATPEGRRGLKVTSAMLAEPHIDPALLGKVQAPTLIVSGDHDLIQLKHTVQIYESLPNANLAVLPNNTHMVPFDDPALFNATVQRFLQTPFKKKDRIGDTITSYEKLLAGLPK